jgi:hypothetical protein
MPLTAGEEYGPAPTDVTARTVTAYEVASLRLLSVHVVLPENA